MIAWFARNGVAANLLMVFIIVCGLYALSNRIPLEVFPSFELDVINVQVAYRGASPAEVEETITIKIEEALADLEGVSELRSRAQEGSGSVTVEVASGYDPRVVLDEVKLRVDRISTFPDNIERPVISIPARTREVISVVVAGAVSERELRLLGERVRDDLANLPDITQVELSGVRPYEIAIEISDQTLRQYGLSLEDIAQAIRQASLDLAAGTIKTQGGEVLIRSKGQAYQRAEFERITVLTRADGTRLSLADIATVRDGFEENPIATVFNGKAAVLIDVYRIGDQNAIDLAASVRDYIEQARAWLPKGVEIDYWRDRSTVVKARLNTLLNSALQGGVLVLLLLTLFLRGAVAAWVFISIPVSFLGGLAIMPELGLTLNTVSLFAFILVLGIVVDDAIVTGENIYTHLKRGTDPLQAAIQGTQEVAVPVTFGVLTTVVAFAPLLMVEGVRGQIFAQIPLIVIPVLLVSLVESKLILPAHLRHLKAAPPPSAKRRVNPWLQLQRAIADGLELAVRRYYQPVLAAVLRQRYFTLALFTGVLIVIFSLVSAGHIRFVFFPRVQSEVASATLTMPVGTPFEVTARHIEHIADAARQLRDQYIDPASGNSVITAILSTSGYIGSSEGGGQSHIGRVNFEITPPEQRTISISSSQLVSEWRRLIGPIVGAKELSLRAEFGRGGSPFDVRLSGTDFSQLQALSEQIKARLRSYPGVYDITDSFSDGKQELQLAIKPEAEPLGLSLDALARQVRQAFFGLEVQRVQRGRDDVRVMLRFPLAERRSLANLETMLIRTPEGVVVPFSEVAEVKPGRSAASIQRVNRSRTLDVLADVNKESADVEAIKRDLSAFVADLVAAAPGVTASLEGEAREQRDSFRSLAWGMTFVLFALYTLLAIPFRSYSQPLMVMAVIPFGVAGAILGHLIMGMALSIISVMGMLALSGVVVNDSLVLVDYVNRRRREGVPIADAVRHAGVARFRAVLLTSLTTFAGLMPLIFEKSTQAQFLIPMAVSLGFGILFATFITLLLVPVNYLILDDIRALFRPRSTTASAPPAQS